MERDELKMRIGTYFLINYFSQLLYVYVCRTPARLEMMTKSLQDDEKDLLRPFFCVLVIFTSEALLLSASYL